MSHDWKEVQLRDVLALARREQAVDATREYPLLGVRLGGGGPFLRETRSGSALSAKSVFQVRMGDFIYSRLFAWRGAFGVIPERLDGCFVSSEFPTFVPRSDRTDVRFINYWFRLPQALRAVESDCTGSTPLTRNRYKEQFFLRQAIPMPPVVEQRRIAAHIEEVVARLAHLRTIREEVAGSLRSMLASAFQRVTDGAAHRPMREVAPLVRRPIRVDPGSEYLELGIRSFGKGTFHKEPLPGISVGSKKLFEIHPGDLVFNNVFAWEGAVAVTEEADAGRCGSHRFITCSPLAGVVTSEFLCFYFLTQEGLNRLREASPGGAGRNRTLGLGALANIQVPVPAIEEQLWFDDLQRRVHAVTQLQGEADGVSYRMMPSILDKAFKGEL